MATGAATPAGTWMARIVLAALAAVLVWRSVQVLLRMATAIAYPFGLDYGEGIVLQQALLLGGPHSYGDITQQPHIVTNYPPVYLMVVRLAGMAGADLLAAGRIVSVLSTLAIVAMVFFSVRIMVGETVGARARNAAALLSAMLALCFTPVAHFGPLARVDMLAVALGLAAMLLGAHSAGSPWRLQGAVLLAVLAVFTKQTAIAAPVALVGALLLTRPRDAVVAALSGIGLGIAVTAVGHLLTDGGFLRHLILYNVNRFDRDTLVAQAVLVVLFGGIVGAMLTAFGILLGRPLLLAGWQRPRNWAGRALAPQGHLFLTLSIAVVLTTCLLPMMGKRHASINYGIEWFTLIAAMTGLTLAWMFAPAFGGARRDAPAVTPLLGALLIPFLALGQREIAVPRDPAELAWRAALVAEIRATPRPVIADDMMLLVLAGKTVPWEPAMLSELGAAGLWDDRLIADRIRDREFAFIVTDYLPGDPLFEGRYNPPVAAAIAEAYPVRERRGRMTIHRPRE